MIDTQRKPDATMNSRESPAWYRRACLVMPGGVSSPVRAFGAVGGEPFFVERAEGPYVFSIDGRRFVDLVGAWGPAIVGHAHPAVVEAVRAAVGRGLGFGACCKAEVELAELLTDVFPSIDSIRFVSSGTEATMSAIRLARAVTGRTRIIKFLGCYHGHVDSLLVAAGSGAATFGIPKSAGVPASFAESTLLAHYNDANAVERLLDQHGSDVAAIIVEPLAGNFGYAEPTEGFLPTLRSLCDRFGALLIFDEVMTGFRVAWGGYQHLCGIRPDITCLGKVIGGGMPVAAYGASRDVMNQVSPVGPMYQAGTLSGNPVALAAGIATLHLCREPGFYEQLGQTSSFLEKGLQSAASRRGVVIQAGSCGGMLGVAFSDRPLRNFADAQVANHERFAAFFRAMLRRGVWLPPSGYEAFFVSAAHDSGIIDEVLRVAGDALDEITT